MTKALQKAIDTDPLKVVHTLLESNFWLPSLKTDGFYQRFDDNPIKRFEDDSPKGTIGVGFSHDGDGWLTVIHTPDPHDHHMSCRFRMPFIGGGESHRTRIALLILAEAIRLDNEKDPQHRG